MTYLYVKF